MKIIASLCIALALTGCACDPVVKTEIVTVNKPIPFIPTPPTVPKCEYLVDQLTPADAKTPGRVGQAYVHDMACLRSVNEIQSMIIDQYRKGSISFEEASKRINDMYRQVENRIPPDPKTYVPSR